MLIEILYFDGCPSYERLLPRIREFAAQSGARVTLRAVETYEAAQAERFLGSPTVRVNGKDVDPTADERTDFGVTCRMYRHAEGQTALPPEPWIRDALRRNRGSGDQENAPDDPAGPSIPPSDPT